ncbi:ABC transporter substrate-binding protein [Pararobbsia silviterrae]|uniref:Fe/B12 periplasmic-binding domain-containing protein n=1 Tax=Pararobbsia silviterrae TaxID=1792498 RepID=A0A494XSE6_9BURK|nr:ABC transporter substrate-binding protein [Pararobbsia silviterrae]RKP53562.1 hypothetical protein D7S86_14870 [Pararobbsia silviterrae]
MTMASAARRRYLIGLGALGAGCVTRGAFAAARARPRVASIGWTAADVLLSIGVIPVAAAEKDNVNVLNVDPRLRLPPECIELGLTNEPNLELLHALRPDLIVVDSRHADIGDRLDAIAPVFVLDLYGLPGPDPYDRARDRLADLARLLDILPDTARWIDAVDAALRARRRTVASLAEIPPVLAAQFFMDGLHWNAYGRDTMLQAVLDRLGVRNVWNGSTPPGHVPTLGIEALAAMPDMLLVYQADDRYTPLTFRNLAGNAIWRRLPVVRRGHLAPIPRLYPFGGLDAALHFADELTAALVAWRRAA